MNASRVFIMMGMAVSMSLVACGGATDEFEPLAEQEAELGESGCATVYGTPYSGISRNGKSLTAGSCGTTQQFRTSGSTYTNGTTCPNQYIAEVTGIENRKLSVYGAWRHDVVPLQDALSCERAEIELGAYMHNASTDQWDMHTTKYRGYWVGGSIGCIVWPASGYSLTPTIQGTEGYDTVRVAARATIKYVFGGGIVEVQVPTGVDVIYPPSPC